MNQKLFFNRSLKDIWIAVGPFFLISIIGGILIYKYVNPAPPNRIVISTGDGEGDYQSYAKLYQSIIKEDGVQVDIRPSAGAMENLHRLEDAKSDVEVGFVQDGLGNPDTAPDLSSLGSLYYEPIWVFYRGSARVTRFSQLIGKRVSVGQKDGGTASLSLQILNINGVNAQNTSLLNLGWENAEDALTSGKVDAAFFLTTPDAPIIKKLIHNPALHLMNVDQAEAITKLIPFLHHLVLTHGTLDLKDNLPAEDVNLVSPTATLMIKDSLDSALIYLLLKAISQVHDEPGLLEKKNEFPVDKVYQFPLADEAKSFYKSGIPFWQRYLPFWLATLVDRFILLILPLLILAFPLIRAIPKILEWRVKSRIYQRYGELKFLETQINPSHDSTKYDEHLAQLDAIEDRVNHMKIPLDFSDHLYVLREHIDFVRERLNKNVRKQN